MSEETTTFFILKSVDRKNLLAIYIGQSEDSFNGIEAFTELALVKQHHNV